MTVNKEFAGWVTATCKNKNCQRAFMLEDKKGEFNDEPTEKFYCPECVKNGFKNKKKGRETPEEFLKHNKIKDKVVVREFKKICKTRGKGRSYASILKEAVEVASYYE